MPKMLREQEQRRRQRPVVHSTGFRLPQHRRDAAPHSAEGLRAYAHRQGGTRLAAWKTCDAEIGTGGGIWHETYVVPAGRMESVYVDMPRYGLGGAGQVFPAKGNRSARRSA